MSRSDNFMSYLDDILTEGQDVTESFNTSSLTEEDEAVIFLEALREECTDDEYVDLLKNCAYEMAVVGLIPNPEVCTHVLESMFTPEDLNGSEYLGIAEEGVRKKIVIDDWRHANFNRIQKRTALRMAHRDGFSAAAKYDKYRKLMIQERNKIYDRYLNKARSVTKQIIRNSKNKASNISTPGGTSITKKMDQQINKLDKNARNKSAIKK